MLLAICRISPSTESDLEDEFIIRLDWGGLLPYMHGSSNTRRLNGKVYRYYGYYCNGAYNKGNCTRHRIPKDAFENAVPDALLNHILQPDNIRELRSALHKKQADHLTAHAETLTIARRTLRTQQNKIKRVMRAIEDSGHSRALLVRLGTLELKEPCQLTELVALESEHIPQYLPIPDEESETMLAALRATLQGDDIEKKRIILPIYIDEEGNTLKGLMHYTPRLKSRG